MPRFIEELDFDSKLFKLSVGRIDLNQKDVALLQKYNPSLQDILKQAYSSGYKLIYIFAPPLQVNNADTTATSESKSGADVKIPGKMVDNKTTYCCPLNRLDQAALVQKAFVQQKFRIKLYKANSNSNLSSALLQLAVASGAWSRFKLDEGVPNDGYVGMFEAWMRNSVNKTAADEIFVAYEVGTDLEIGFITVKARGNAVNIGLLSVASTHRRMGIASALLCRAALWAFEEIGGVADAKLDVVTQGLNQPACKCYEDFGFAVNTTQQVYHAWLPDHLEDSISVSDQNQIPFCRQHFTGNELKYINQVLSKGLDSASHFTMMCAAKIHDLLEEHSERVIMVPSGTAALEMAAMLCGLQPGDEVIMPSYTFSSTANAVVLRGAVPVFVDIRADTLNIDENKIVAALTDRTKAVFVVHYGGVACEMDAICAITKKHGLFLVEDNAQGFLSTYKGRPLGTIGDFGCFSFHYTKNVICGEGGAISINGSSNNSALGARAMVMWEKGTNRYDFMMGKISKYEWIDVGSSYVPNELSCAVLWAQLEKCHDVTAQRVAIYQHYLTALQGLAVAGMLRLPVPTKESTYNAHIFYILLPSVEMKEHVLQQAAVQQVSLYSHYVPLHSAPAGRKHGRVGASGELTVTDEVFATMLRLPVWCDMTLQQADEVVSVLTTALG